MSETDINIIMNEILTKSIRRNGETFNGHQSYLLYCDALKYLKVLDGEDDTYKIPYTRYYANRNDYDSKTVEIDMASVPLLLSSGGILDTVHTNIIGMVGEMIVEQAMEENDLLSEEESIDYLKKNKNNLVIRIGSYYLSPLYTEHDVLCDDDILRIRLFSSVRYEVETPQIL